MRIRKDGVIEWLSPPPGFSIPVLKQTRTRFSEIVPCFACHPFLYLAFRIIRFIFGEGKWWIPEWTRRWVCTWRCTILRGPSKGMFKEGGLRCVLIDWEHDQWAMNLRNQ